MDQRTQPTTTNDLQALLGRLQHGLYADLDTYSDNVLLEVSAVRLEDADETLSFYLSLAEKLAYSVKQFLRLRKFAMLPYVQELLDKDKEGHDCRNCAKSCSVRHLHQTVTICDSHQKIKEILYRLQSIASPIYMNPAAPIPYGVLRNQVMILDRALTETFYEEESRLIPLMQAVQHHIYAHG